MRIILFAMLFLGAVKGFGQNNVVIGKTADVTKAISADQMLKLASEGRSNKMVVKGTIESVCQKKGCWMKMNTNEGTVHVSFKDYKLFMPKDLSGKEVVMVGKPYTSNTSVEELRHYAQDANLPQKEIEKITEPKKEIRFEATGVTILK